MYRVIYDAMRNRILIMEQASVLNDMGKYETLSRAAAQNLREELTAAIDAYDSVVPESLQEAVAEMERI